MFSSKTKNKHAGLLKSQFDAFSHMLIDIRKRNYNLNRSKVKVYIKNLKQENYLPTKEELWDLVATTESQIFIFEGLEQSILKLTGEKPYLENVFSKYLGYLNQLVQILKEEKTYATKKDFKKFVLAFEKERKVYKIISNYSTKGIVVAKKGLGKYNKSIEKVTGITLLAMVMVMFATPAKASALGDIASGTGQILSGTWQIISGLFGSIWYAGHKLFEDPNNYHLALEMVGALTILNFAYRAWSHRRL